MKMGSVTITYNEEKLAALRLYMGQKNQTVEDEMTAALEALYTKTVPTNVRDFIDLRAGASSNEQKKRKSKPREEELVPMEPLTDGEES